MINPKEVTNFNRTQSELEEFAIYSILVANNNSDVIAPRLDRFLQSNPTSFTPLNYIFYSFNEESLKTSFRNLGIGKYGQKANGVNNLVEQHIYENLNLSKADTNRLEMVRWIGMKTSRFFVLHSRYGARCAAIDTHILKGLRHYLPASIYVPTKVPGNKKEFLRLEGHFIHLADMFGQTCADLDIEWWIRFREE